MIKRYCSCLPVCVYVMCCALKTLHVMQCCPRTYDTHARSSSTATVS